MRAEKTRKHIEASDRWLGHKTEDCIFEELAEIERLANIGNAAEKNIFCEICNEKVYHGILCNESSVYRFYHLECLATAKEFYKNIPPIQYAQTMDE